MIFDVEKLPTWLCYFAIVVFGSHEGSGLLLRLWSEMRAHEIERFAPLILSPEIFIHVVTYVS